MKWQTVALGDVASIERSSVLPADIIGGTRYVGLEHIESGGGSFGFGQVANGELASNKFRFTANHILFGKLRPYLAKIVAPDFEGICSTDILPILPSAHIDKRYLLHFLKLNRTVDWAANRATGANLPRLSPSELVTLEIPLPPLPEQRRIAAILDRADELRRKRKRAIELLESACASYMEFAIEQSAGEKTQLLGSCLDFITTGGRNWSRYYSDDGERFIRSLDVRMNSVSDEDPVFVEAPNNAEARRTKTNFGDVLLTVTGSRIGRAAALPNALSGSFVSQHVAILRPNPGRIQPRFLSYFLTSRHGQRQIAKWQYGQTKPGLNFAQIENFVVPCIDLDQQGKIEDAVASFENESFVQRQQLNQIDLLFSSLQHRAFSGQL